LAPAHVVILPIYRDDAQRSEVLAYCRTLQQELASQAYGERTIEVNIDDRDLRGGEKKWYHVKRGVPLRVEIGPKDIAKDAVFVARRDTGEQTSLPRAEFVATASAMLDSIQKNLFERAAKMRAEHTRNIDSVDEFREYFTPKNADQPEIHGGFAMCHFASEAAVADLLNELKVTIRCIPLEGPDEPGRCFVTGQPSQRRAIFAKAY
jgi:prolyl-tRNA synthetase